MATHEAVVASCIIRYTSPMLTISSMERRALRAKAHHLHPVVAIGQHGLTPSVLREIDVNLRAHELIKVRAFSDIRGEREALLGQICAKLDAAPVQHIGKLLILWRPAPKEQVIKEKLTRTPSATGRRVSAGGRVEEKAAGRRTGKGTGKGKPRVRVTDKTGKMMAKSAPQARRPRSPAAKSPARPPAAGASSRRGPAGVPSAPLSPASRERRRRRTP
jgi:RNA-binding protein